jgi:circadian clock protein KaiC
LEVQWHPPTERVLDILGHRLLHAVRTRGVKRLFVDGVDGFFASTPHASRITHFLSALTTELRTPGVTTLYTVELHDLFGANAWLPMQGISCLVENILLTRFVEHEHRLHRTLTVIKTRDNGYDHTVRELLISSSGVALGGSLPGHAPSDPVLQHGGPRTTGGRLKRFIRTRGRG